MFSLQDGVYIVLGILSVSVPVAFIFVLTDSDRLRIAEKIELKRLETNKEIKRIELGGDL